MKKNLYISSGCRRLWQRFFGLCVCIGWLGLATSAVAAKPPTTVHFILSDGLDMQLARYPARGSHALLWIAPDFGERKSHMQMADMLADAGIDTWMLDITEALFLERGSSGMRAVDGRYIAEVINHIHQQTGKPVMLMSSFYGAIPVLRAARQWQLQQPQRAALTGAILFSPSLNTTVPKLGQDPEYLPILDATNIPVLILQEGKALNRWQLRDTLSRLQQAGSPAYARILPDTASVFYLDERDAATEKMFQQVPSLVHQAIRLFEWHSTLKPALPLPAARKLGLGLDTELRTYQGKVRFQHFKLPDLQGRIYDSQQMKGKITLLNLWATWCPPCVEEIPMLNNLARKVNHEDFQIVSIDYGEDPEVVREFLSKVPVEYPVLLDRDGTVSRDWKVFAYPSTFVIDRNLNIVYGVNAAIDWDDDSIVNSMRELIDAKQAD